MVASAECALINSTRAEKILFTQCVLHVDTGGDLCTQRARAGGAKVEHSYVIIISSFHFRYIELAMWVLSCQRRYRWLPHIHPSTLNRNV